ncbi:hypothetical protein Afil01_52030 [Actinorhabdospora filicis]|uniref:Uncharacterized protein n=1 Tax=Actinorhabdospora filicis TaxID=1785913 RepID=A0A9W6STD2_9ACTN|nr:hypothetical protein [Actinorhabdospora filicis]GLZ80396.1 hypothetical protein Afil01_52030 [Actinorhabdospora filicis]
MGLAQDLAAGLTAAREAMRDVRGQSLAAAERLAEARDRLAALTDGTARQEPLRALAALEQAGEHLRQGAAAVGRCDEAVGGYVAGALGFHAGRPPTSPASAP